jgi:hypothetical protein
LRAQADWQRASLRLRKLNDEGVKQFVAAANKLYLDAETGRPRRGVAGSGKGSARRFGLVLRQFDLTFDPEIMPEESLINILPYEFDIWKKQLAKAAEERSSSTTGVSRGDDARI